MKKTRARIMDMNLLPIAVALFKHENVSKAASELGISQPGVSLALARLRLHFEDELFIRTRRGLAPTDYALTIKPVIFKIFHLAEELNRK